MTPKERAEKIVERFSGMTFFWGSGSSWLKSEIAAQIEEAERDAVIHELGSRSGEKWSKEMMDFEQGWKQGFAAACEKAREIAENEPINAFRLKSHEGLRLSISDRIGKMKP